MGWKGMAIGGWLGSFLGGPLGALLGAALGHKIEKLAAGNGDKRRYAGLEAGNRSMIFCASAAAMLAKMAKADGCVTRDEIASVERAFARLGFSPAAREYAIRVFRRAKDDAHTIDAYASEFARVVDSVEVRELFYEILWEIAAADGVLSASEREILARMPRVLSIRAEWYAFFARRFGGGAAATPQNALEDSYRMLGASLQDSDETLKRKYRDMAKKNHPDVLRAQGLPEEMVGKATERMSRINAAWAAVREARGI